MERRIFNDTAAKERAQLACKGAPETLESILTDNTLPPRNRIEASKELRAYAHNGKEEHAVNNTRFLIHIDLSAGGGDVEIYDKPIRPDPPMLDVSDDKQPKKTTGTGDA